MLDEFGTELENADSKLDSTMKKVAKVLRMSNGKSKLTRDVERDIFHVLILFFLLIQIKDNGQLSSY